METPRILWPTLVALAVIAWLVKGGEPAPSPFDCTARGQQLSTLAGAEPWTVRSYLPTSTNGPGIPEPTVRVHTMQSTFRRRGFNGLEEEELVKGLAAAEAGTFESVREFSREHFFVSTDVGAEPAYASSWRHDRSMPWRNWMMVRGDQRFQIYAVPDKGGWSILQILDRAEPESSTTSHQKSVRDLCFSCLPPDHRSERAIGPPFSDGRGVVSWHSASFAEVPFSSFVDLYRTLHQATPDPASIDDFRFVANADGTTRLHARFPTRTTRIPFVSSRLKSQERPSCTVPIEHRTHWTIDRSGFTAQIRIDAVAVGREQCCGEQTFTRPPVRPLCIDGR